MSERVEAGFVSKPSVAWTGRDYEVYQQGIADGRLSRKLAQPSVAAGGDAATAYPAGNAVRSSYRDSYGAVPLLLCKDCVHCARPDAERYAECQAFPSFVTGKPELRGCNELRRDEGLNGCGYTARRFKPKEESKDENV